MISNVVTDFNTFLYSTLFFVRLCLMPSMNYWNYHFLQGLNARGIRADFADGFKANLQIYMERECD